MAATTSHLHTRLNSADHHSTLKLSQHAPSFLHTHPRRQPAFPFSIFAPAETPELWASYENLLLTCLRTGDDRSARECLERISARFGMANERVMGLRGMFEEAIAEDKAGLERVLKGYEDVLKENPVNVPILKRRIALLRSMSRSADAIAALVDFLDVFQTDGEAWCELSDLYQSQGLSSQAVFCLEEALLIAPNAWNLHAKLGEVLYISTTKTDTPEATKSLSESVKRFCRSIELCDDYLRGYYGLHLSTSRLLERMTSKSAKGGDSLQSQDTIQKLHELATRKLREIVKSRLGDIEAGDQFRAELIAAQELLDREAEGVKP